MTAIKLIGALWFASGVIIAVIQNFVFMYWLKKQGVRFNFGLAGTPGYLDCIYVKWCKSQGRSPKRILLLRVLCLANAILAAIVMMCIMSSAHTK